jgi:hypothetical protein
MSAINNDDLKQLVESLDIDDDMSSEGVDVGKAKKEDKKDKADTISVQDREEIELDRQVIDTTSFKTVTEQKDGIDLNDTYEDTVQKLIENYDDDRQELTKHIKLMSKAVNQTQGKAVRVFYETLANLLRTRSESNATLIKLLENIGRRMDKTGSGIGDIADMIDGDGEEE